MPKPNPNRPPRPAPIPKDAKALPTRFPQSFTQKKAKILRDLAVPDEEYHDASPKGSVDTGIRELVGLVNGWEGLVTTSSCAGRVSVFLEGMKKEKGRGMFGMEAKAGDGGAKARREDDETGEEGGGAHESGSGGGGDAEDAAHGADSADHEGMDAEDDAKRGGGSSGREKDHTLAATGGKGGGGRWLFMSHDPVDAKISDEELMKLFGFTQGEKVGLSSGVEGVKRLLHFKFEPMILHVLTASLPHANAVLSAALQAGFRESGALSLTSSTKDGPTPMVGIRSMGMGFESIIGIGDNESIQPVVDMQYLKALLRLANERFVENTERIRRLKTLLVKEFGEKAKTDY